MTTRLSRAEPWPTPSKRAHAELGHRRLVEDVDFDAELFELLGTLGEFFRIEDVGRLVDETTGEQNALGHRLAALGGALGRGRIFHRDRNRHGLAGFVILFLGLVEIELIAAQRDALGEFRRCRRGILGVLRQVENDGGRRSLAGLAGDDAAEAQKIPRPLGLAMILAMILALGGFFALFAARADDEQALDRKLRRGENVECGRGLALEFGGARRLLDERDAGLADQAARRLAQDQIFASEDDQGRYMLDFATRLCRRCSNRQGRERNEINFCGVGHVALFIVAWPRKRAAVRKIMLQNRNLRLALASAEAAAMGADAKP